MKIGDLVQHHKNHLWVGLVVNVVSAETVEVAWVGCGVGKIHPGLLDVVNENR